MTNEQNSIILKKIEQKMIDIYSEIIRVRTEVQSECDKIQEINKKDDNGRHATIDERITS